MRELDRVIVRPEVKEEKPRLFSQHMAVDGRHLDAVRTQRLDDGIYFVAGQDEVTGDRCLVATGWLEVDARGHPHRTRRGDRHSVHRDVVAAGDADLIDASVGMTLRADNLVDLGRVQVKGEAAVVAVDGASGVLLSARAS